MTAEARSATPSWEARSFQAQLRPAATATHVKVTSVPPHPPWTNSQAKGRTASALRQSEAILGCNLRLPALLKASISARVGLAYAAW